MVPLRLPAPRPAPAAVLHPGGGVPAGPRVALPGHGGPGGRGRERKEKKNISLYVYIYTYRYIHMQ